MKHLVARFKKALGDQKGFSLVELIIVIAIMAVLVGTVGAQVIPYMNNAKKARDIQILSSYATAGVIAYSIRVEDVPAGLSTMTVVVTPGAGGDQFVCSDAQIVADEVKNLVAKDYLSETGKTFKSKDYHDVDKIEIVFDFDNHKVYVIGYVGATAIGNPDDVVAVL